MNPYKQTLTVRTAETDNQKALKPSTIMSWAQEIAHYDAEARAYGFDDLMSRNLVWVVSRFRARIERLPQWREQVNLETWHKGPYGILALRDYAITDLSGQAMVNATSAWVILNTSTRRIQRFEQTFPEGAAQAINRHALVDLPVKIETQNGSFHRLHKVHSSDIDFNGHVNNAKYLEWAEDCMYDVLGNQALTAFEINLNSEAHFKNEIALYVKQSPGILAVEGMQDQRNVFRCLLHFRTDLV